MARPSAPPTFTARLKLSAGDLAIDTPIAVPAAAVQPEAVLPALQTLINAVVDAAEARETAAGREISCRKGCGACCRQLVPVSRTEARALRALIAVQPPQRRHALRQRFAQAAEKLRQAGLAAPLLDAAARQGRSDRDLSLAYFAQAIACPFLEEESCSIHPDRPLVCREYLVTSPAALCSNTAQEGVTPVPVPKFSLGARGLERETATADAAADWIPLALVLEHPAGKQPRPLPGRDWLQRFFAVCRAVGGRDA
ncbi:MAG: YkgJ family cysteine cluster protein [Reyranellaceae bacterium]